MIHFFGRRFNPETSDQMTVATTHAQVPGFLPGWML